MSLSNNVLKFVFFSLIFFVSAISFAKPRNIGIHWLGVNNNQTLNLVVANSFLSGNESRLKNYKMWGLSCYSPSCTKLIIHDGIMGKPVAIADRNQLLDYLLEARDKSRFSVYKYGHYNKLMTWILDIPQMLSDIEAQGTKEYKKTNAQRLSRSHALVATRPFEAKSLLSIVTDLHNRFKSVSFQKDIKGATTLGSLICKSIFL